MVPLGMRTKIQLVSPSLPDASLASCLSNVSIKDVAIGSEWKHTVVALGNPVLNTPTLGKIGYLGPVLIRVSAGALGTTRAV